MNESENRFPIEIVMLTYIIIYVMYIVTFSRNSALFFLFFILERLMSLQYDEQLEMYINRVSPEEVSGKFVIIMFILTFAQIGIFIFSFFKYPGLFMFLMLGELIDFVTRKIKIKMSGKK